MVQRNPEIESMSFGALGLDAAIFDNDRKEEAAKFVAPPPAAPPPLPSSEHAQSSEPFRFVSWNDEDEHPGR